MKLVKVVGLPPDDKRPVDELYKAERITPSGHKINTYYLSEADYLKEKEDKEYYHKAVDRMMELIGYETGMVFPTSFAKKYAELKIYGNKVIYETIEKCASEIEYAVKKYEFTNEYNKMAYLMTIVSNKINDVYKDIKKQEKANKIAKEIPINPDLIIDESAPKRVTIQKTRDISRFLKDGDY